MSGITIYTKSGCPYCKAAKEDFDKQGVCYDEVNVTDKPEKIDELVKLSGVRKVPVIVENGKVTVGYKGGG